MFGKTEPTCKLYDSDGMYPLWYARGSIFMAVIESPFWAVQVMFSLRLLNENCFRYYQCNAGMENGRSTHKSSTKRVRRAPRIRDTVIVGQDDSRFVKVVDPGVAVRIGSSVNGHAVHNVLA